ncbi:putative GNAT family N-acyltransferase [Pseudomonas sp. TE3610]
MQPMKFVRIGSVCVAERFCGNGIGRKLVNLAQDWGLNKVPKTSDRLPRTLIIVRAHDNQPDSGAWEHIA